MNWYVIDTETRMVSALTETRTLEACRRIVGIAIGRWIMSGLPYPDSEATDGVSEQEAALDY